MDAIAKDSLLLYDICCSIGISSSQRERNIQFADYMTTFANTTFVDDFTVSRIMCGSVSEGIGLFPNISRPYGMFSDLDFICIVGGINVQEHVDTTNTNQTEVLQLLYTDSPEHVLLEVKSYETTYKTFNNTSLAWMLRVIVGKDRKHLVSSSLLKEYLRGDLDKKPSFSPLTPVGRLTNFRDAAILVNPTSKNTTIHGPALMPENCPFLCRMDIVFCFRCNKWPTTAHEWIDRARPHGWPNQDLIDQIMNDGCELVPVGRKDHPDGDEEWKLSFSRAETRLIRTFNIYQAQCYQLLKIVKHHFISSVVADSLSSYHIKTVMLHTVEQTDQKVWRKDNLTQCFMMCLSNLKRYLTAKFLPQYFIVKQNLLEPKVTGDVHQKVLGIVTDLDKIGWKCIHQCPVLQGMFWLIRETVPYKDFTNVSALQGNKQIIHEYCLALLLNVWWPVYPVSYNSYLIRIVGICEKTFLKPTESHPSVEVVRVLQLLRKSELGLLLTVNRAMAHPHLRPGIKPMMNFARQCLSESCHADVSSCRLRLATFFFNLGEYDRCKATVLDVLERFKDVWIVVGRMFPKLDKSINEEHTSIDVSKLEFKLNQVLKLSDNGFPFISNHMSLPAIFIRWEVAVAPKGVQFLNRKMPRRNGVFSEACCIDSIVYAHYLLLETYLKKDEHDLAEHALFNMKESIRNGNDDMFDRNCLCFCEEDNLLLQYSDRLMKVANNVKDK